MSILYAHPAWQYFQFNSLNDEDFRVEVNKWVKGRSFHIPGYNEHEGGIHWQFRKGSNVFCSVDMGIQVQRPRKLEIDTFCQLYSLYFQLSSRYQLPPLQVIDRRAPSTVVSEIRHENRQLLLGMLDKMVADREFWHIYSKAFAGWKSGSVTYTPAKLEKEFMKYYNRLKREGVSVSSLPREEFS